jgi:hypothetical protein
LSETLDFQNCYKTKEYYGEEGSARQNKGVNMRLFAYEQPVQFYDENLLTTTPFTVDTVCNSLADDFYHFTFEKGEMLF